MLPTPPLQSADALPGAPGRVGTAATREPAKGSAAPAVGAVAAWGAGLIAIALGAGVTTGDGTAWGAGLVIVTLGAGALVWGAASLARGHLVCARAGVAGALGGMLATVAALWLDPGRVSALAVAAASALFIAVAMACGACLRREAGTTNPARLTALIVAAVVVAAVVTPALASTEAGRLAPDHGGHGVIDPGHH